MREFIPGCDKEEKTLDTTSHSSFELILAFSHHSGSRDTFRNSSNSFKTHLTVLQKRLQILLSLFTGWISFNSFPFHVGLTIPLVFWATILKAHLLGFVKNVQNTVTHISFKTKYCPSRQLCCKEDSYYTLHWDKGTSSNSKTNVIWFHFPPSASSHLGALHFSWR